MVSPIAVVITRPEHLAAMRERLECPELTVLCDADSLHLLEAIAAHAPLFLVIHQTFAATSRGAMLVAGMKSEPAVMNTEVRVFIEDEDKTPLVLMQTEAPREDALLDTSRPLDRAGTRQAARYRMNLRQVLINGEPGQLVDLSVTGAQVQMTTRVRPAQVVRFALPDKVGDTRCQGTVAWSIAVPKAGAVHCRAGIEFIGPDFERLAAICSHSSN